MPAIDLTDNEVMLLRLALSIGMEKYAKDIKRCGSPKTAIDQFEKLMQVVYGKINPDAWTGGELNWKNFHSA